MTNDLLGEALKPIIKEAVNDELKNLKIEEQVKASLTGIVESASKTLTVKLGEDGEPIKMGLVHKDFEIMMKTVAMGENLLLVGGAGRGKTTAIVNVAKALGLKFRGISFTAQTTKSDLLGFTDAMGIYRPSVVIEAMINGDILLFDEFDAGNDNAIMAVNTLVENRWIDTPNGVVYAHENFRVVASANTNLRGATSQYSARRKLDDATIDRYAIMEWSLDEELEKLITANDDWLKIVRAVRKACNDNLDGIDITPRPSYKGAKMLKGGIPFDNVVAMTLFKGLDDDSIGVMQNAIDGCGDAVRACKAIDAKSGEPEPKKVKTAKTPKTEPKPEVVTPEIVEPEKATDTLYEW